MSCVFYVTAYGELYKTELKSCIGLSRYRVKIKKCFTQIKLSHQVSETFGTPKPESFVLFPSM